MSRITCLVVILASATASPVLGQTWPDPVAHDVVPYLTSEMTHGPCLGTPTANSVRIWIRTRSPMPFSVLYGTQLPLTTDSSQVAGRPVRVKWIGTFPDNVRYSRLRRPYFAVVQVNNVTRSPVPHGAGYQWMAFDAPQVVVRWHDGYTGRLVYAEGISADTHTHSLIPER